MEQLTNIIIDDKITGTQLKLQDVIDNRLPVAIENLDLSHMIFENGKLPDLSYIEIRNHFDCAHTNITSFSGFPDVRGGIDISNTMITSLEGCPKTVQEIEMSYTEISSFKGCPDSAEIIDAWKTNVSTFGHISKNVRKLSIGRTKIRDLSKCPDTVVDLTADYLDVSTLKGLPHKLTALSIAGSSIENFKGMPKTVTDICCYHNDKLNGFDGLNIEALKGIAIVSCPNVLEEEVDAYHKIIKVRTLLQKREILEKFLAKKEDIIRQKQLEEERRQYV